MMLAFSLPFVGPLSDVVSVEHVGVQLIEEKGGRESRPSASLPRRPGVGILTRSKPTATVSAKAGIPRSTISSACFPATTKPLLFLNETVLLGGIPSRLPRAFLKRS